MHTCIPICPIFWVEIYYVQIGMLPLLYGMNRIRRIYTALIAYLLTYTLMLYLHIRIISKKSVQPFFASVTYFRPYFLCMSLLIFYTRYTICQMPKLALIQSAKCQSQVILHEEMIIQLIKTQQSNLKILDISFTSRLKLILVRFRKKVMFFKFKKHNNAL